MKKASFWLRVCALLGVALFLLTGCVPKDDALVFAADKLFLGELTYRVNVLENNELKKSYQNHYKVEKKEQNGQPVYVITSIGSDTDTKLNQTITLQSVITLAGDPLFLPLQVDQQYTDSANQKAARTIKTVHNLSNNQIDITYSLYEKEEDPALTEKHYSFASAPAYYDADSLSFIFSTLPLAVGYQANFQMSSSNRQGLQSMNFSVVEETEIEVPAGTFTAYAAVLKPNTLFTNYATYFYFAKDYNNLLLMITQPDSNIQLETPVS